MYTNCKDHGWTTSVYFLSMHWECWSLSLFCLPFLRLQLLATMTGFVADSYGDIAVCFVMMIGNRTKIKTKQFPIRKINKTLFFFFPGTITIKTKISVALYKVIIWSINKNSFACNDCSASSLALWSVVLRCGLFSSRSPEVNDKLENNLYLRVWFVRVQGV